jgi:hypothetical protein
MRPLYFALLAISLNGCANVEYTAYSGAQQKWPVASGSFVQRKFDLPVYFGPPDRPYQVLGYMEVESAPLSVWESGKNESIKPAVKEAAKHGADAVILLTSGANVVGASTFNSANWGSNTTTSGGFTAITFWVTATQVEAPGEPVRRCRCVEATQPQLPLSFYNFSK